MEKLIDIMEDDDDVQNVWHNWEEKFPGYKAAYLDAKIAIIETSRF